MKKTTLYIEDDLVRKLKEETIRLPNSSMTKIINEALRNHFDAPESWAGKFENLKKAYGTSEVFKNVDPVEYQRKLRSEWD